MAIPDRGVNDGWEIPMRTAIRDRVCFRHIHRPILWACAIIAMTTACAVPRARELAELQRDHELCLASDEDPWVEVRYADYQACMNRRGWSDADLPRTS